MKSGSAVNLSRRERQIMDIVYQLGEATAAQVMEQLPDPPSYSSVRATLRILEEKGHLKHDELGPRYLFSPVVAREKARSSALKHLMQTFFDNSAESVVATLMDIRTARMTDEEYERLARLIEESRKGEAD